MVPTLSSVLAIGTVAGALAVGVWAAAPDPAPRVGHERATAQVASRYLLPLVGEPAVVHPFDAPAALWAAGHRGVDLSSGTGQVVLAPAGATVSFAGTVVGRGVITLAHPDGLRSSLEPVEWSVGAGAHVAPGQVIGTVQPVAGHCAPASCLHWGVRRGETYLDPLSLLVGAGPAVLLPEP